MTFTVIDSASAMRAALAAPDAERDDLLRDMWAPLANMYSFVPGGVDMADVHRQSLGFTTDAGADAVASALAALAVLEEADAWARISAALDAGAHALRDAAPLITVPDITVLLVLGDHTNAHFMEEIRGLSAFGGISGFIVMTVWPTPEVLDRLEAIAVHELHHNVRYSPGGVVWDPATVTVGEQVIAEGLADVFATELYGDRGLTHFVSPATRADDAVVTTVATGLDITGMQHFTAWIHGDASARLFGAEPVGLPTGAGYAAGERIVRDYLDAVGSTAAANVAVAASEIIDHARGPQGLLTSLEN